MSQPSKSVRILDCTQGFAGPFGPYQVTPLAADAISVGQAGGRYTQTSVGETKSKSEPAC